MVAGNFIYMNSLHELYSEYISISNNWPLDDWSISKECFDMIIKVLPFNSTILEIGSGHSTELLSKFYNMISIENNKEWINKYKSEYIYIPLSPMKSDIFGDTIWLDADALKDYIQNKKYDLLLVDSGGDRVGILDHIDIFNNDIPIIFDDTMNENYLKCATLVAKKLNKHCITYKCAVNKYATTWFDGKQFSIIIPTINILFVCPYYNNSHFLPIQINSFKKYLKNCNWKILVIDDSTESTVNIYTNQKEDIHKACLENSDYVIYLKYPLPHSSTNAFIKHQEILNYMFKVVPSHFSRTFSYMASFDADMCFIKEYDVFNELYGYDIIGPKRIQSLGNIQLDPKFPLFTFIFVHCAFFNIKTITNIDTIKMGCIPNTTTDTGAMMVEFMYNNPKYTIKYLEFTSGQEGLDSFNLFEFYNDNTFIHYLSGSMWSSSYKSSHTLKNIEDDVDNFRSLVEKGLTNEDELLIKKERDAKYRNVKYHKFFTSNQATKQDFIDWGLNIQN